MVNVFVATNTIMIKYTWCAPPIHYRGSTPEMTISKLRRDLELSIISRDLWTRAKQRRCTIILFLGWLPIRLYFLILFQYQELRKNTTEPHDKRFVRWRIILFCSLVCSLKLYTSWNKFTKKIRTIFEFDFYETWQICGTVENKYFL